MSSFIDRFLDLTYNDMKYRLFVPSSNCDTLILHLHGSAGRGNDNIKNLNYMDNLAYNYILDNNMAYVLAPQIKENEKFFEIKWDDIMYDQDKIPFEGNLKETVSLLKMIIDKYHIKHVYIEGYSMGGFTTIEIASRFPYLFDGLLVICGGFPINKLNNIKNKKIIIVHGKDDNVVPHIGSIKAFEILKKTNKDINIYLLDNVKHNAWEFVYNDKYFLANFIK